MANRKRTRLIRLYVTEEEWTNIEARMKDAKASNFSDYARRALVKNEIVIRDFSELKELTRELGNLARSINQIALRVNETRSIYEQDVKDLQGYYANVKRAVSERLVKMAEDDYGLYKD
ncbi:MAG: plasmid mobilization relaxosome protein MobC [Clostridia bacterium]|nr:plasmid mobilization relaxosome protein MobC [Clostridia bacterium]